MRHRLFIPDAASGAYSYTLATATWAATAALETNARTQFSLGSLWASTSTTVSYNAHYLTTLASTAWAATSSTVTVGQHYLAELATAAWGATTTTVTYNTHRLISLASTAWGWASSTVSYSFGGPTLVTLARAGWGWMSTTLTTSGSGAGGGDDYWRTARGVVTATIRSVMRNK